MNILNNFIFLVGRHRYFLILLSVVVLGAMPVSGHLAWQAYHDHGKALERLMAARQAQDAQNQQMQKIQEYKQFVSEVQAFTQAAQDNRLEESDWTTYQVDIKDRLLSKTDMLTLLNTAAPTSRYYFKPKRLVITSLFARDTLPVPFQKALNSKEKSGGNLLNEAEKSLLPGDKVLFSLSGTYLLFPRS
ncbi:MAG: hypothetical protein H7839_09260 [Magnetococcus sp. YQC-5]